MGIKTKLLAGLFLSLALVSAYASEEGEIRLEQKLGTSLSGSAILKDEAGRSVNLGSYFGHKPILLSFVYFKCPNLCTLVLNQIVEAIHLGGLKPGDDVELLSISINPNETPALALAKKRTYLARLGLVGDENPAWHFLTAHADVIQTLTEEAGFHFKYDPASEEYNHPSGFILLTSQGKISGYFSGVRFDPNELKSAVKIAALGETHKNLTEIILNCFHYLPEQGKHGKLIVLILQGTSLLTLAGMGGLFIWMSRKRIST
jgi:protein SCO1/2